MKILQVLHDYLPAHVGGTELHAHQLALALQKRGHEVACLFTERDLQRETGTLREGRFEGVRTLERVHQREYADVHETWIDPAADHDFARILDREAPDVVHVHHLAFWGPRCLAVVREHGAALVVTLHDYHALCDRGTLSTSAGDLCANAGRDCTRCLERYPLATPAPLRAAEMDRASEPGRAPRADDPAAETRQTRLARAMDTRREHFRRGLAQAQAVLCPSRFLARTFTQAGFLAGTSVDVLSPGTAGPMHEPRKRKPGKLRLGFVGGLYPEKGAHVLIEAMRELARAPVELHVHGVLNWFPDYVAALQERARGLPVHFHGRFDPRDVDRVYAGFDVLVVPSLWYENHPLTIQDAYRNGMTVIATDLGGMAEVVQDGINGLLFPRGDARALARAIERLWIDPRLYERLCRDRPRVLTIDEVAERVEAIHVRCAKLARR